MRGVTVVIPAYGLDSERAANCDAVLAHLHRSGLHTLIASPLNGGSMAHARNLGAELAAQEDNPPDVLVFNDADSIVPERQMLKAIHQARQTPGLVYAYDLYVRLGRKATRRVREGYEAEAEAFDDAAGERLYNPPSMGCVAISVESFQAVGGFDQRFVGWGYEDVEFARRCAHRWPHGTRRVPGILCHLWHGDGRRADDSPLDASPDLIEANRRLFQECSRESSTA